MIQQVFLADAHATEALGRQLAESMPAHAVLFLGGDLGAGKSSMARAMLRRLGVTGTVRSPTYTLVERYQLHDGEAVHMDLYRITGAGELEFLGLEDFAREARLMLVEWPERAPTALPPADIELGLAVEGEGRRVTLRARSDNGRSWLARLNEMAAASSSS